MRRRDFIALIGSGVTARPLVARAQQIAGLRRIGLLMAAAEDSAEYQGFFAAFRAGLRDLGWIDGRNLAIDTRWCGFNKDLTQQFAKELVARQPELIVSSTTPTTAALQQQTRTIPIVFVSLVDPIGSGFVDSLPRPGGNLTGFINNESTMTGKWLELLKEIAPGTARAAILFNPMTAPYAEYFLKTLRAIRSASGIEAIATPVHDNGGVAARMRQTLDQTGADRISNLDEHDRQALGQMQMYLKRSGRELPMARIAFVNTCGSSGVRPCASHSPCTERSIS
jgi:putative ABC transport system substrate-binding protein